MRGQCDLLTGFLSQGNVEVWKADRLGAFSGDTRYTGCPLKARDSGKQVPFGCASSILFSREICFAERAVTVKKLDETFLFSGGIAVFCLVEYRTCNLQLTFQLLLVECNQVLHLDYTTQERRLEHANLRGQLEQHYAAIVSGSVGKEQLLEQVQLMLKDVQAEPPFLYSMTI